MSGSLNEKFLGDTGKYDLLGVKNGFRKLSELYIKQLVEEGKWFTVCHKIDKSQIDIMSIQGDDGSKLGAFVADSYDNGPYRTKIYKYLLKNFLCYIEVPTVSFKTDTGGYRNTFNKVLATSNINVISNWVGVPVDELPDKYRSRIFAIDFDDGEDELPYVKLTETAKDGVRRATCPRDNIDVSVRGTRVIPLFMLKSGVDALYSKFKEKTIKVSFLKDNSQVRDIFTTTNFEIIKDIYGKDDFYDRAVLDSYEGDFLKNKNLHRGYIRVPEIGGSRYDNPVRSINYARIINIDYNSEPDLSFVNIDLGTVVEGFQDGVMRYEKQSEEIISMIEAFGIDTEYWNPNGVRVGKEEDSRFVKHSRNLTSLLQWVDEKHMLLSTVFDRDLCLFMLANPQWFGDFTGVPKNNYSVNSSDVGLA